jgi:hypothetical protein
MVRSRCWHHALLAIGLLLGRAATADGLQAISYHGEARSHDGRLLFEEQHLLRDDAGRPRQRLVLYRCPGGEAFARKILRYGERSQQPEFALFDARFGYREGFELGTAFVQLHADAALRRQPLAASDGMVVDAGIDAFVHAHWQALQRGDSLALDLLQPDRLTTQGFALRKLRDETIHGEPASVFRLGPSGLFGWFAEAIELSYRQHDQRRLRVDGESRIRFDLVRQVVARVDYPPQRETAASDIDWYEAEREPLLSCALGG